MKRLSTAFLTLVALTLFGCGSAPVAYNSQKREGQWEAKAQIRDLEKSKSNTLSLDVMAEKDHALRLEISGTLGIHVASLLMKDNEIAYAIHTQKRYISGPVSERALGPLLNIDVDPRWLYNIFFDEPISNKSWVCSEGADGLVDKCERDWDHTVITWSERDGEKKRIVISNPKFELQILVKNFMTKVQSPEKAFSLDPPESYKRYKLK